MRLIQLRVVALIFLTLYIYKPLEAKNCGEDLCFVFQKRISVLAYGKGIVTQNIKALYGDGSFEIGTSKLGISRTILTDTLPVDLPNTNKESLSYSETKLEYRGIYFKFFSTKESVYATLTYEELTDIQIKKWTRSSIKRIYPPGIIYSDYSFSDLKISNYSGELFGMTAHYQDRLFFFDYKNFVTSFSVNFYRFKYSNVLFEESEFVTKNQKVDGFFGSTGIGFYF